MRVDRLSLPSGSQRRVVAGQSDDSAQEVRVSDASDVTGRLANGGRWRLHAAGLDLLDAAGGSVLQAAMPTLVASHRGGTDLTITRSHADPITLVTASLDDAKRLDSALRARISGDHAGRRPSETRAWWTVWRRSAAARAPRCRER
jgi:hypothetical protein